VTSAGEQRHGIEEEMTAPARITQADMEKATKAAAATGLPARVVFDLDARRIEIIIGESVPPAEGSEKWSDDDV
jgi:hypothetical protein